MDFPELMSKTRNLVLDVKKGHVADTIFVEENSRKQKSKKNCCRRVNKTKKKKVSLKRSKSTQDSSSESIYIETSDNLNKYLPRNKTPSLDEIKPDTMRSITLDADVLRWENKCDNDVDEMRRIEVYKVNRRLRYANANNTRVALLAIKDRK
ncbi:uncharacterized protein LOC130624074 [Hydractinia symbiolongicarpus]|uniref:uncharacterized protein LOC130624074 n=1 Tax=Hydractinia symbiolongicarpus TaxID=13093 RepID=UPI002549CE96|nr:uncharacterized protein LOC130624074 [Hydractinia symbiolongicarpus]